MTRLRTAFMSLVLPLAVGASLTAVDPSSADTLPATQTSPTVAVAETHSLLISGDGRVYGAGSNQFKALGSTCVDPVTSFCQLESLPDGGRAVAVAASAGSSYALSSTGTVYGMGFNDLGQVTGPDLYVDSWQRVLGQPEDVTSISATYKTLAVTGADGIAYETGANVCQMGGGEPSFPTLTPMPVASGHNIGARQVALSDGGFCVVLGAHGTAYGVGDNAFTQITGNTGSLVWLNAPGAGVSVRDVALGYTSTSVLGSDGNVYSIGNNLQHQLGDGSTKAANESSWAQMIGINGNAASVAAGGHSVLVGMQGGSVYGVGDNLTRALTGNAANVAVPTRLLGPSVFDPIVEVSMTTNGESSFLRDSTGVVFGAGDSTNNQLALPGSGSSILVPSHGQVMTPYVAPAVTGSALVGGVLSAYAGRWSVVPDEYSFHWFRNGIAIGGAGAETYTLGLDDAGAQISVLVTGVRTGFTGESVFSSDVNVSAVNQTKPSFTGALAAGHKITAKPGTWYGVGYTYSYQWLRNGTAITKATKPAYVLTAKDRHQKISVRVTAAKTGFAAVAATSSSKLAK